MDTDSTHSTLRDFEHSLPMMLLRAREHVMQLFRPVLLQYDLTEQQWRVLRALVGQEGLEISRLSEGCCILPPSMSGILKRLENRGLIRRKIHPQDQRSTQVGLTPKAIQLIAQLGPLLEAIYTDIEQSFGYQNLEALYGLLDELEAKLKAASVAPQTPENPHDTRYI